MKISRILIPAAWLLSLAAAFVIGKQISPTPGQDNNPADINSSPYSSAKYKSSSGHAYPTRKKSTARSSKSKSSGKQDISTIATDDDPVARTANLLQLINTLGPNDFEKVVADFRALGITRERMAEYKILLHAWAQVDPLSAIAYADKNTGTQFARQTILASWAGNDPEAAIQWAKTNHEGDSPNPWLVGVIRGLASKDSSYATEVLHDLPYSSERGSALRAIIPHISKLGHDSAVNWLKSINDEQLLNGATTYLASSLAKKDAQTTADWIYSMDDSEAKARAAGEVAEQWAEQDFPSALAWTKTLDGNNKTQAAREIIGEYARETPQQAADWLRTMSGEPEYERVVRSYIWNTARNHPEHSLSQISEIKDTNSQNRYYERILRSWKGRDANAAEIWMANNSIPDQVRQRVNR